MMDSLPSVMEVFDTTHRFHIYDHTNESWIMSGVAFDDVYVVQHQYEEKPELYKNLDILTDQDDLTLIWEDGKDDADLETIGIDEEVANDVGETLQSAVAAETDETRENIRIAQMNAPNEVIFKRR